MSTQEEKKNGKINRIRDGKGKKVCGFNNEGKHEISIKIISNVLSHQINNQRREDNN
jgi:hypothetical protein